MITYEDDESKKKLRKIQELYGIEEQRFVNGFLFATLISEGRTVNGAYVDAFEVTPAIARTRSSQLYRAKWIQTLLGEVELDVSVDDRDRINGIKETLTLAMEDSPDEKIRIDAATKLSQVLQGEAKMKIEEKKIHVEEAKGTEIQEILRDIKAMAGKGKVLSLTDGVIDTEVIL
jgi:hypothetical protein